LIPSIIEFRKVRTSKTNYASIGDGCLEAVADHPNVAGELFHLAVAERQNLGQSPRAFPLASFSS